MKTIITLLLSIGMDLGILFLSYDLYKKQQQSIERLQSELHTVRQVQKGYVDLLLKISNQKEN